MPSRKAYREAKAAIAEVQARIEVHKIEAADRAAKAEAARVKLRRFDKPATVQRDGFAVELTDMAKVAPSYYQGGDTPTVKTLTESLESGVTKIDYGPGTSRGVKSLARILRVTIPTDSRALARLDKRIAVLQDSRADLIAAMHERGIQLTPEAIAKHAAALWETRRAIPHIYSGQGDWDLDRLNRELADATSHLDFLVKGTSTVIVMDRPVCPCIACVKGRNEAVAAKAEAERIAQLPRVKVRQCPCGKSHIVALDRARRFDDETREWVTGIPVFTCPTTGTRYIHDGIRKAEAERAAKDAERRLRREGVSWQCPDHAEPTTHLTLVDVDDDMGLPYVVCNDGPDGDSHLLSDVAPRAYAKWRKARDEEVA